MGTTSQKLSYLNDTKGKLKDSINKFRDGITDQTKFRDYATELDDIYDLLPKVDNTSDASQLLNAQNGLLDDFKMYGNTQQDSYTGQQLFNVHDNPTYDQYITLEEDYITCERTNTGTEIVSSQIYTNNLNVQPSTTYLCVCEIIEVSGTGSIKPVSRWVNQNQGQFNYDTAYAFSSLTAGQKLIYPVTTFVDLSNKTRGTRTVFEFQAGEGGRIKIRLSILTDTTITSDTFVYEPYVGGTPSPNPDYPQEVKVVKGNNTINVTGKNLFDKDSQNLKQGYILNDNGEETQSNASQYSLNFTKVKPNTTYTIQGKLCSSLNVTRIYEYDENKNWIKRSDGIGISSLPYTFTTNNNTYYLRFQTEMAVYDGNTVQLELGSTATEYEPYQGSNYTLNLGTTELCKIGDYQDYLYKTSGKNLFDKNNANILNSSFSADGKMITSSQNAKTLYIPCKPNTTYTISKIASQRFRLLTTEVLPANGVFGIDYGFDDYGTSITITTSANIEYLCVYYYLAGTDTLTEQQILDSIQIEEGSTATDYEPFGTDWYIKKEIGKVVLNGSENWFTQRSTSPYVFALNFDNYKRTQENICKCNFFSSIENGGYGDLTDGQIRFRYNSGDTIENLYVCTTVASTVNDFKTWLSTHNTTLYYVLLTPTYETITNSTLISQLESIKVNTGSNYFTLSNSNNVLPTLYVSRLKELDSLT